MKTNKLFNITLSGLLVLLIFGGCTEDFVEINTDKTKLTSIDQSTIGSAFANAEWQTFGSYQIFQNLFADLYAQYFTTITPNFPSDRHVQVERWIDASYRNFSTNPVPSILEVIDLTEELGDNVGNAVARIWKVYMFHRVTDYFGPIPYSQLGSTESFISYDDQETIYMDFFDELDAAIAVLESNPQGNAFGTNDLIYAGNAAQWLKFANTLRLRLALRISSVNATKAQEEAEKAIASGVMTDNTDNAFVAVNSGSFNQLNQITAWNEFRMSSNMESLLKGYNDPRISSFFAPIVTDPETGEAPVTPTFEGARNGLKQSDLALPENKAATLSNVADIFLPPSQNINPKNVMYCAEAYFLRAEGALNSWNMGGTAEDLYNMGIEKSLQQWGTVDATAIQNYIDGTSLPIATNDFVSTPPVTDIPVQYDPANALEQIHTQKWLALYPDGWEAWAEMRRTGFPKQYDRISSDNPDAPADQLMRRLKFVTGEYTNNIGAMDEAVQLLGGPDKGMTRLWWDPN